MRCAPRDGTKVVRIANAVEPDCKLRSRGEALQPLRQGQLFDRQCTEHHAFVMGAAAEPFQIFGFDNGVTQSILDAMGQHRLQRGDARFQQPNLAQRLRPVCEQRQACVQSIQALFLRRLGRRGRDRCRVFGAGDVVRSRTALGTFDAFGFNYMVRALASARAVPFALTLVARHGRRAAIQGSTAGRFLVGHRQAPMQGIDSGLQSRAN